MNDKEKQDRRIRAPRIGLVTQLVFKSMIFSGFLLAAICFFIFKYQKNALIENVIQKNSLLVTTYASFMSDAKQMNDDLVIVDYIERMKRSPMVRYIMVLDDRSRVVFHSDMRKIGKTYQDAESLKTVASQEPVSQEIFYEGESLMDFSAPILVDHKKAATLRAGFSRSSIDAGLEDIKENLSVVAVAGLIIVIVGSFIINSGIGVNINHLMNAAKEVSRGEFPETINVTGAGELGYLARVLERMFEKFKQDLSDIETQKKELRKNYDFFIQNLAAFIDEGIIIMDSENKIIFANESSAKTVGFSVLGCMGKHMLEIIKNAELIEFLNSCSQNPNIAGMREILSLNCTAVAEVVKEMSTGKALGTVVQLKNLKI
ncbi:hypothetical protein KJ633_03535 [bacterium]|nr:HAMP domain-containing protein [bacterium]MBU3955510.1 hypothetical protein [bacterium]MBU4134117.1 hypothetical protein [bacterium]